MNYYFLAASLPMLSFESAPPMTAARFLEICRDHLTHSDMAELDALVHARHREARSVFARSWTAREAGMRNTVVAHRASRLGCDPAPYLHEAAETDVSLKKSVSDALARKDPLEAERGLDRLRWTIAEELKGFDPFAPSAIFAYGLQLAIAERWTKIDREKGGTRLEALVAGLT